MSDGRFFYHQDEVKTALRMSFWAGVGWGAIVTFIAMLALGIYAGV